MSHHDSKAGIFIVFFSIVVLVGIVFLIAQSTSEGEETNKEYAALLQEVGIFEKSKTEILVFENKILELSNKLESKVTKRERVYINKEFAALTNQRDSLRVKFNKTVETYNKRAEKLNGELAQNKKLPIFKTF